MLQTRSFKIRIAVAINWLVLFIFVASVFGFLSFKNAYGLFLASVTAFIALGIFKRVNWGYFAAAPWGLACFQLAKQGYEFQTLKREVMTIGFILIPICVFLHEILAKKNNLLSQESAHHDEK